MEAKLELRLVGDSSGQAVRLLAWEVHVPVVNAQLLHRSRDNSYAKSTWLRLLDLPVEAVLGGILVILADPAEEVHLSEMAILKLVVVESLFAEYALRVS